MRFTTPKNHIIMHKPYTLGDFGESPASITGSWSDVYRSDPVMGSGKANKYAMVQPGYNQYARVNSGTLQYPFTWCAWLKKFAHKNTSYPIFLSYGLPYMACNGSGDPFRFSYRDQSGTQSNLRSDTIPSLNTWYHMCVTDDGTTLKLYINGNLEDSTTNNMTSSGSSNSAFDMGRHYNNNNYRIHGAVDDVRVYDVALEAEEIQALADLTRDERVLEIKSNGDIILNNYISEEYDWKLLTNFASDDLDPYSWYETDWPHLLNTSGAFVRNSSTLDDDGWTKYLTTIDTSSYTRYRGYMQFFYSSSPNGYIYKDLPTGYSRLRVRWGNWYSGSSYLDLDGSNVQTIGSDGGSRDYETDISGGEEIRFRESGIVWPGEIWVGNPKSYTGKVYQDRIEYKLINSTGNTRIDGTDLYYSGKIIVR